MNTAHYVIVGCLFLFVLSIFFAVAMVLYRRRGSIKSLLPKGGPSEDPMVVLMKGVFEDADSEAFKEVRLDMVHEQAAKRKAELVAFFKGAPTSP